MELIATIILIIAGSALLHMDEYKSSNRILPEGYEIDRVKATQNIIIMNSTLQENMT